MNNYDYRRSPHQETAGVKPKSTAIQKDLLDQRMTEWLAWRQGGGPIPKWRPEAKATPSAPTRTPHEGPSSR